MMRFFLWMNIAVGIFFISACASQSVTPAKIINLTIAPKTTTPAVPVVPNNDIPTEPVLVAVEEAPRNVIAIPAPGLIQKPLPPQPGPGQHLVQPGDTLYSLSRNYGKTPDFVAQKNDIVAPYTIYPGDILTLDGNLPYYKAPRQNMAAPTPSAPSASKAASATSAFASKPVLSKPRRFGLYQEPIATLRILSDFGDTTQIDPVVRKSRIYQGLPESPVYAMNDGFVAYTGSRIKDYGSLILIEHGDGLMSAYGFLAQIDVKVGQQVKRGSVLGELGQVKGFPKGTLLFQIRKSGKPVHPATYFKTP